MVDLTSLKRDSPKYTFRLRVSLATFPPLVSVLRLDFRKRNSAVSRKNKMRTDRARRICTEIKKEEKKRERMRIAYHVVRLSLCKSGRNGSRYRPFCASLAPDITENMHLARGTCTKWSLREKKKKRVFRKK